ncbi:hypothetical protein [Actinomycetospora atypica]|uniref:HTH cro/C1-type domain-containing protein n=1 Tax=Actinomycetospora atypica TaxID=1290095 RepID=A0ABV9YXT7_9PSEU
MSRFEKQPIRDVVREQHLTQSEFIEMTGVRPFSHVRAAMNGVTPPSEALRQRAVEILNVPLDKLFTAEALAATKRPWNSSPARREHYGHVVQNATTA